MASVEVNVTADKDVALELRGINKFFGGVHALRDIDLTLRRGEITALVGDNGAGKSTLTKIISGIYTPDSGTILLNGDETRFTSASDASDAGIQTVYQDLALCDNLNTIQNLFLGREIRRGFIGLRQLKWAAMEKRGVETLASLGVKIRDVSGPISTLSGGQRQGIAICRSILTGPDIVLLDEPTAALGVSQRAQVRELLNRLREQGLAVMLISHDMQDVRELADSIEVLRLGAKVATFSRGEYSTNDLLGAMTGAAASESESAK